MVNHEYLTFDAFLQKRICYTHSVQEEVVGGQKMPFLYTFSTDYKRPVRKSPSLHGQKSTPNPKFLGTTEAYFVCPIGSNFQIYLLYAFIGCP